MRVVGHMVGLMVGRVVVVVGMGVMGWCSWSVGDMRVHGMGLVGVCRVCRARWLVVHWMCIAWVMRSRVCRIGRGNVVSGVGWFGMVVWGRSWVCWFRMVVRGRRWVGVGWGQVMRVRVSGGGMMWMGVGRGGVDWVSRGCGYMVNSMMNRRYIVSRGDGMRWGYIRGWCWVVVYHRRHIGGRGGVSIGRRWMRFGGGGVNRLWMVVRVRG